MNLINRLEYQSPQASRILADEPGFHRGTSFTASLSHSAKRMRFSSNLCLLIAIIFLALDHNGKGFGQETRVKDIGTRKKGIDWAEFLGPNRDSKSPETGILKDWSGDKLKIKWTMPLTESYGIGSVSRGRFFQFDRAEGEEVLFCLNAETGKEIWKKSYEVDYRDLYGYNSGPRTSPVIDDDRVYTYGVAGDLRCWQVADGKVVWKLDVNEKFGVIQNFFGVGSTPVIYKDLLIAMVGGSPAESKSVPPGALDRVVGNGSGIVAFDKNTGEMKYKLSDELASYSSPTIARIGDKDWCFAFCRGGLLAFDPATGKKSFHYPWRDKQLESVNASNPVVVKDQVFISETYGIGSSLLKIKPDGYDVIWKDEERSRKRAMETHWNTAIYHEGYFYGSSGRHTGNAVLKCIEAKTGEEKWRVPGLSRSSLMYVDGHFVCLTEVGRLFLFKATPDEFKFVTQIRLDIAQGEADNEKDGKDKEGEPGDRMALLEYPCWSAPILSHGLMYVRGPKNLVCLELIKE